MNADIKRLAAKLLENHGDDSVWNKWARRFVMGIDLTIDSAEKALKFNESKFKERTGTNRSTLDCYYDMISEENLYYCEFIARSCACRAAIAWGQSTLTDAKLEKDDLENEVIVELNQARNSLDCIP